MIAARFRPLLLPPSAFLAAVGPFEAAWDGERFVLGFRVENRHCNAAGFCHGGMLATLCDVLLTVGGNVQSGLSRFLPTVSMTCDYLAPAACGSWIEGRLDILRVTRNLMFASGVLEIPGDGAIVRTSGVLKIAGEPDPRFDRERYFA